MSREQVLCVHCGRDEDDHVADDGFAPFALRCRVPTHFTPAAPPSERVPEIAEPWMIYAPSIRHVQRTYAERGEADAYCADLNRASSNPEWVVVDARIIAEAIEYCAAQNRRDK